MFTEHLHDRPDSYLHGAYILIHGIYWTMFWAFVVLNVLLASAPLSLQAHCKEVNIYRCSLYHYYCYYYCTDSKTKTSRDEQLTSISREAVVCPAQNSTIVFLASSVGIYTALANELQVFSWCVWKKLLKQCMLQLADALPTSGLLCSFCCNWTMAWCLRLRATMEKD